MSLRQLFDAVADVVFPPSCAACDEVLNAAGAFCEACSSEVVSLPAIHCSRCAEPGEFEEDLCPSCRMGSPWERAWAPFEHEGAIARAIHRFKYEDRPDLSRSLGMLLADAARPLSETLPGVIVPLPLHELRFRERRFDQAALLARTVAEALGRPMNLTCLERIRDTRRQVGLSAEMREENVRGAFRAQNIVGQSVVLIDDVLTSGATAREAAHALRAAGSPSVFVLTLARARSLLKGTSE